MKTENEKNFFYINQNENNENSDSMDIFIKKQQKVTTSLQKEFSKDVMKMTVSEFESALNEIYKQKK